MTREMQRMCLGLAVAISCCSFGQRARAQLLPLGALEANAVRARSGSGVNDARIAQAKARIDQARSAYAPQISLAGDVSLSPGSKLLRIPDPDDARVTYLVGGSSSIDTTGAFDPVPRYGITLDVHGNLYDFGRTAAAVDAAVAQRRAAQADALKASQDVVRDVRLGYVRWATAHALWSLAQDASQAAERRGQLTAAAIEEGSRPSADRIADQTDAAFAELELERASATLESARIDLGFVCVTRIPETATPDPAVLTQGDVADAPTDRADPALSALEQQRTAARANARVYDHAFTPVLSAQAQAGVRGQPGGVFPLYRVGVNLLLPLWDGGSDSGARAQSEARAAELAAQASEYSRQREYTQKRTAAVKAQAERRMSLAQRLVELSTTRVGQLEEGYPLGAATLAQLADARGAVQRARTELVLAQASRAEALLGL